jgi:hypothetical protein
VPKARFGEHPIDSVKGQRDELDVQRLQVRKPREHMCVEREQSAGNNTSREASGPSCHQPRHRNARQCKADHHEQVVNEHR